MILLSNTSPHVVVTGNPRNFVPGITVGGLHRQSRWGRKNPFLPPIFPLNYWQDRHPVIAHPEAVVWCEPRTPRATIELSPCPAGSAMWNKLRDLRPPKRTGWNRWFSPTKGPFGRLCLSCIAAHLNRILNFKHGSLSSTSTVLSYTRFWPCVLESPVQTT